MKNYTTYKIVCCGIFSLMVCTLNAQRSKSPKTKKTTQTEANERLDNYLKLSRLGYSDKEIFQDLGNANFMAKKYESALFWYDKLKESSRSKSLSANYQKRYQHALNMTNGVRSKAKKPSDWIATIQSDYHKKKTAEENLKISKSRKFMPVDFDQESRQFMREELLGSNSTEKWGRLEQNQYDAPIALTKDGMTAYFSKPMAIKPLQGIFSKKEVVHKVYRAEKINGQWKNVKEVPVCPKYASAMHPTVSPDGKKLFFASNMKGSFGEYDIYISEIKSNGEMGISKNLGRKVNTKKDDLYPKIAENGTLFFASEGRKGYGGLDVYMTEVSDRKVAIAANLGSRINSASDDFAITLLQDKGMGYVMSNRGENKNVIQKVAFSYGRPKRNTKRAYDLLAAFNKESKINYTSTTFEEE